MHNKYVRSKNACREQVRVNMPIKPQEDQRILVLALNLYNTNVVGLVLCTSSCSPLWYWICCWTAIVMRSLGNFDEKYLSLYILTNCMRIMYFGHVLFYLCMCLFLLSFSLSFSELKLLKYFAYRPKWHLLFCTYSTTMPF